MTFVEIEALVEEVRIDALHDVTNMARIHEALISLMAQRDALMFALKQGITPDLLKERHRIETMAEMVDRRSRD